MSVGRFEQISMVKAVVLQPAVVALCHVEASPRIGAAYHCGSNPGKDGHASRYHPLQELAKDPVQTSIWGDALKLLYELPQPGKEEGIEGGIHGLRLDRSLALWRCRHGTTSFPPNILPERRSSPSITKLLSKMWVKSRNCHVTAKI